MKALRRIGAGVIVLGVVLAVPAQAQIEPTFRTRYGIAVGGAFPIDARDIENDPGVAIEGQIGVGDDPVVVSLAFGYTSFSGPPLDTGAAVATQFELRTDWCPTAPAVWSPIYQVGVGVYRFDRPMEENEDLRFGARLGLGLRWAPAWHTCSALVVAYNFAPDLSARTRHWATIGVELLRWSE